MANFFYPETGPGSKPANFHPEQGIQSAKKMLICESKTIKIQKKINVQDRKINLQCISDAFRLEDKKDLWHLETLFQGVWRVDDANLKRLMSG